MRKLFSLVLWIQLVASAASVSADVLPPDVEECQQKLPGQACSEGVCVGSTCSSVDYANWDRDASATPPTKQAPCTRCVPLQDAVTLPDGAIVEGDGGANQRKKDSGCSVGGGSASGLGITLLVALALVQRRCR